MGIALQIPATRPEPATVALWLHDLAKAHGQRGAVLGLEDQSMDQARSLALQATAMLLTGPERDLLEQMNRALWLEAKGHGYTEADANYLEDRATFIRSACDELCRRLERLAESMTA